VYHVVDLRMSTENILKKQTTPKMIEVSFSRSPETKELSVEDLHKMLAETIQKLDNIEHVNNVVISKINGDHSLILDSDTYYNLGYGIHKGSVKRDGAETFTVRPIKQFKQVSTYNYSTRQYTYKATTEYEVVDIKKFDGWTKDIKYLKTRIADFNKRLDKGTLRQGDWMPYFTSDHYSWESDKSGPRHDMIISVGIPDTVKCNLCDDEITMKGMSAHQKRVTCKDKAYRKSLIDGGLERVPHGGTLYRLAKRGLITSELVAIDYDVFVPAWIVRACDMYEKDKTKFANMKLEDFIARMRPEDSTNDQSTKIATTSTKM
jgi:hypothetical protein